MKRFLAPLLIGLLGTAVLMSLGAWQVQRLTEKESVLAEIDARMQAAPVEIPPAPTPENDTYLSVVATGRFGPEELHVLVSAKGVGAAYRIISPFETLAGRRILVDRGIVPDENKNSLRSQSNEPVRIEGNLHWPEEIDGFTPRNDVERNIWFSRDVSTLAAALETEPVLLVLRTSSEASDEVIPLPLDSSGIPNDHLQYAVTWFGLAAVWILMTGIWMARIARGKE